MIWYILVGLIIVLEAANVFLAREANDLRVQAIRVQDRLTWEVQRTHLARLTREVTSEIDATGSAWIRPTQPPKVGVELPVAHSRDPIDPAIRIGSHLVVRLGDGAECVSTVVDRIQVDGYEWLRCNLGDSAVRQVWVPMIVKVGTYAGRRFGVSS